MYSAGRKNNDSIQIIENEEFISFWGNFNKAFLKKDTFNLSELIYDDFYGFCSPGIDISDISGIDFSKDSTISKSRFMTEFIIRLNPVFIELLEKFEVDEVRIQANNYEDFIKQYSCSTTVENCTYFIGSSLEKEKVNEVVTFQFTTASDDYSSKNIRLDFRKFGNVIKLSGMDCYSVYFD